MKRTTRWMGLALMLMAVVALALAGCASKQMAKKGPETFPCAAKGKLVRAIAPEAKLVAFNCFFKKWKGQKVLHFKVTIKNVSDQDQRYRVNIFMDNGKAVGGLLPRKTKKGLIKPGASASFVYPVRNMSTKANEVTLIVKTMGK